MPTPMLSHLDRCIEGYHRTHGEGAPKPTHQGCYETDFAGHHYIVVGNAERILACYRLARGALRVLLYWPRGLTELHGSRKKSQEVVFKT